MIVPVDGHWLNLMMGKRFHENLNSNSNSENDSTSSYECLKPSESEERPAAILQTPAVDDVTSNAKEDTFTDNIEKTIVESSYEKTQVLSDDDRSLLQCSVKLDKLPKDALGEINVIKNDISVKTHSSRIATMNLEVSKLSTKNIIEHSKIMSLQHMDSMKSYSNCFPNELDSSGDETSSRGTLDVIIPPLKDFQGKNNPFLMQNSNVSFGANLFNKQNVRMVNNKQNQYHSRFSLPGQWNQMGPLIRPLKRKLSEKDIIIGPNGEVKRRKYRRPRKYLQVSVH